MLVCFYFVTIDSHQIQSKLWLALHFHFSADSRNILGILRNRNNLRYLSWDYIWYHFWRKMEVEIDDRKKDYLISSGEIHKNKIIIFSHSYHQHRHPESGYGDGVWWNKNKKQIKSKIVVILFSLSHRTGLLPENRI